MTDEWITSEEAEAASGASVPEGSPASDFNPADPGIPAEKTQSVPEEFSETDKEAALPAETAEAEALPSEIAQPALPEEDTPNGMEAESSGGNGAPDAAGKPDEPETVTVVDIQFRSGTKVYYFDPGELVIHTGEHVIMDTARGNEFGYCVGGNHTVRTRDIVPPLRQIIRIATEKDEEINRDNIQKEKKAYDICLQKIQNHGLDMQLVSAEYAFDNSKIIFFFTAEGRVDFRELVKNLASVFRTRIELRQIGVRDKAKMVGGLGICGRPFCCKEFLDDFQPVSIKMAKTQNLSLNPTKISGTCGRLMCCLKYEQDAYEDLLKTSPKNDSFVDTADGRGTIIDVNLLRQTVRVRMEDQPDVINTYPNTEICVLRSGKAKKNDLPIPKDVAPLSSQPRPAKKVSLQPEEPLPEVIIAGDMPTEKSEGAAAPADPFFKAPAEQSMRMEKNDAGRRHRKRKTSGQPQKTDEQTVQQPKQGNPVKPPRQEQPRQNHPRQEHPKQSKPRPPKQEQPGQFKNRQSVQEKQSQPADAQSGKQEGTQSAHRRRRRPYSGSKPGGSTAKQSASNQEDKQ